MSSNIHWAEAYRVWTQEVFGVPLPVYLPEVQGICSFPTQSPWFVPVWDALFGVEVKICGELFKDIENNSVPGDIAEFGVFEGTWLNQLYAITESVGVERPIWALDSYEGLSKPHPEFDNAFWQEGMYAASLERVRANVRADERPRFRFVQGFFSESLAGPEAQRIEQLCFARIDCDIYQPAIEILAFLSHRLAHGSIIVFDDWLYNTGQGEVRAFVEWRPTVPHLEFEFLFFAAWGSFYVRCWHKGKPRHAAFTV